MCCCADAGRCEAHALAVAKSNRKAICTYAAGYSILLTISHGTTESKYPPSTFLPLRIAPAWTIPLRAGRYMQEKTLRLHCACKEI